MIAADMKRISRYIFPTLVLCALSLSLVTARAEDNQETGLIKRDVITSPKFGANTNRSPKFGAATDRNSIAFTKSDFPTRKENNDTPHEHVIVVRNRGFSGADKDRSGKVTRDEYRDYQSEETDGPSADDMFDALDTDRDSILSRSEFKAHQ